MPVAGSSRGSGWMMGLGGLLLGILIGTFTAKSSSHSLEVALAEAREELKEAKKNANAPGNALARGLREMMEVRGNADASKPEDKSDGKAVEASPAPGTTAAPEGQVRPIRDSAPNSEDRKKMLDTMAATWRLRSTQAKASFLEAADLNPEQRAGMDKVVEELNAAVKNVVNEALASGKFKEKPESRDVVDMMVNMGEVYLQTDDHLRQVLTPEQLAVASEQNFDVMSQVDPEVVMPLLMQLEANAPQGDDEGDGE